MDARGLGYTMHALRRQAVMSDDISVCIKDMRTQGESISYHIVARGMLCVTCDKLVIYHDQDRVWRRMET